MAIGPDDGIYVSDHGGFVFKVGPDGTLSIAAGAGGRGFSGDGGQAGQAMFAEPTGIAFDAAGALYIVDHHNHRIRRVDPSGIISTIAGSGGTGASNGGFAGDGGPATAAELRSPIGVVVHDGVVYVADSSNGRIRAVDASAVITTVAGGGGVAGIKPLELGVPATEAALAAPIYLLFDASGELIFTDRGLSRVLKIGTDGVLSLVAGTGSAGFAGDGGLAADAELNEPTGLALDANGNLYIADTGNQRIRRIQPTGIIDTIAGTGDTGFAGDGGPALSAQFHDPFGLVLDSDGNLWIADFGNGCVRRIDAGGDIETVACGI